VLRAAYIQRVRMKRAPLLAILLVHAGAAACGAKAASSGGAGDAGAEGASSSEAGGGDDAGGSSDGPSPPADASYADPGLWLCGANTAHDYCLDPQVATAIHPDNTQTTSTLTPATSPALDCFYVYPSVDITSPAGNETNYDNLPDILDPIREQAAPFSQVCKVYAPLYHQATYQSYYSANANQYLEAAYVDVAAAFQEYLTAYNHGRPFVLLGHSQGAQMLRRLIQRAVETTPAVASQMRLAVLAGAFGDVTVPKGQVVGGSFQSTPLCTTATQRGCVLTFNSFAKGYEPTSSYPAFAVPAGMDVGCSNPAAPGGGKATFADSFFFTQFNNAALAAPQNSGVSTPFASYAAYFTGECLPSAAGYSFLEIDAEPAAGDQRSNPIPFSNSIYYAPSVLGLHLLDYGFPMGDLLAAVQARDTDGTGTGDASSD
jgi:hypothetical protein